MLDKGDQVNYETIVYVAASFRRRQDRLIQQFWLCSQRSLNEQLGVDIKY